ncbi:putative inactive cadmium/zinc-transporting ATPase HMA3 isoform X2 [Diospyros lotus]|uniref:putative inactive cadmium/zinc-transporting ATPase HMA3 isoform X2 n=1 Tax=Diospyros lotus TaxID=55363 RepID=UPI002258C0DA|nr:putative inactive cadmium/zinc-transporting ATPase HMA3 isoform X2 [Diospyros lotus]
MGGDEENKASRKFQKSYFEVLGLCCTSEVPLIEKILKPLDGVKDVTVIVPTRTVIVVHDSLAISQLQIVKALNQARLEANIRVYGEGNYQKRWPSPYAVACVIGSIALHDYWEAGSIVFLFTIAQWLESRASHKATAVMSSLMNMVPQKAVFAETGEEVDADQVKVNTVLAVKAGEIIPIDGIVVQGKCDVDEKALTGESFPVPKQNESTVWAGTINLNGYINVKTTALSDDCVVARMAKLVEEAQSNKSRIQRFIDRCAKFYTPAIVAISVSLAVVPAILRVHNQNHWFHLALVILVSACPCALILSTPVATFCALSKAATSGLLIKGGEYLETLSKVKIVAFDKTGTITRGEFVVTDFQSLSDDVRLDKMLYWVSSIESKSSHPMAAALVDYGRSLSVEPKSESVEEFENFPGEGIHGKIDGKDVYVGNRKIALRAGCPTVPRLDVNNSRGGTSIGYIFLGAAPAGIFSLSDACRTGVKEAVDELKSMGIKTAMLTGDSLQAAKDTQHQLDGAVEVVHAELLPEDKSRIIKDLKKEAPTAMVGDGLNDAPALAIADIGISMGISGSALATETGQIILMSNDIRKIPEVIRLARRTRRKVIENVIVSIFTKAAILGLAFAGYPLVWAAVLADVGTCLVVIFNSMLLLRGKQKHASKCCSYSAAAHVHKQGSNSPSNCTHSFHSHQHACDPDTRSLPMAKPRSCCSRKGASNCHSEHVHKQRSNSPSSCTHLSHSRWYACDSGCNSQPMTKPQGCCSRKSAPNCQSALNPAEEHGSCTHHALQEQEANLWDLERCDLAAQLSGSSRPHKHGCSGHSPPNSCPENKGTNFLQRHSNHCKTPHAPAPSCSSSMGSHLSLTSPPDNCQNAARTKGDCHLSRCKHSHRAIVGEETGSVAEDSRVHGECKSLRAHNCSPSINKDIAATQACLHLEKRQTGGCCNSFRKECCGKSGANFGAATLGGGLSEIVIE